MLNTDQLHIHESYPWHCGEQGQVSTTNDKYVTCPNCLANKRIADFGRHVFTFPRVKFADTNTLCEQLHHGLSEANEVIESYYHEESYERIAEEIMDKIHSAETELIILSEKHGVDLSAVKRGVIEKNAKRGYYTIDR